MNTRSTLELHTMRDRPLPFSPPFIGQEEIDEVADTLRSDWITTGPKVKRFEQEFGAFVDAPAALAVNSCTAALHLALVALGIGPGDCVVSTPMTFCSSIHVIEHVGATPVLVDVEPDTLNIDANKIDAALRLRAPQLHVRAKALLPVHLYGHPCDMDALLQIASSYGLAVVEDAAHALPATHRGRVIGSFASASTVPVLTAFSFYATKNLTTAEGGMLVGSEKLIDEARTWSLHGMSHDAWKRYGAEGSWFYEVTRPGFKYNMSDIQAAIGLQQLRKLTTFQKRRCAIVERYNEAFRGMTELKTPVERPEAGSAWHLYVLRLVLDALSIDRSRFIHELQARNIGTSVHFIPVHLHPYYRDKYGFRPDDFPVAFREYQRIVSLPLYPKMSDSDVQDVIDAVQDVVQCFRR
jgi:dTDP-4-amino-4,6-dideoxygalactose transaminase